MRYREEIFWVLSSCFLFVLSRVYFELGPEFSYGPQFIFWQSLFLCIGGGVLFYKEDQNQRFRNIHPYIFFIGIIPILFTDPLFENDHYRYLWEGKAWFLGINPYQVSAMDIGEYNLESELIKKVAYPHLTSVYPLLSQLWFALFGIFPWKISYILLKIANSLIVFNLFKRLHKREVSKWILLSFPFFIKEFIQGVHIDLLAFYLLFVFISKPIALVAISLSFHMKIIGGFIFPFVLLIRKKTDRSLILAISIFLILTIAIWYFTNGFESLIGIREFSKNWVWNPGFYSILIKSCPNYFHEMRSVTLFVWMLFYLFLFFINFKFRKTGNLFVMVYLIFSSLMFFTPVYNAWYSIWFLVPACLMGIKFGMAYALLGYWGYMYHGSPEYIWLAEIVSHVCFIPSLIEVYRKYYRVEEQDDPPKTQNLAQN